MRGSTELPECRCGLEMKIIKSDAIGSDAEVRTYRCPQCEHELRLTIADHFCNCGSCCHRHALKHLNAHAESGY
jgi:DNA-directed RNA polymerase subunit RPC12/RpoP